MKRKLARAVIPALLGWIGAVSYWIAAGPDEQPDSTADVAIVLGAAVYGNEPSPVFRERITHAIDLYEAGRVERVLFTGGKSGGDELAESVVASLMAAEHGVASDAVIVETESATTMENLENAQEIMNVEGLDDAIIVSDPLHLRRAMEMAEDLGIAAMPSATPTTRYRSFWPKAKFLMRETYFMHHYWLFGE